MDARHYLAGIDMQSLKGQLGPPHLLHIGGGHSLVALAAAPVGLHGRRLHRGALRLHDCAAVVVVV